MNSVIFLFTFFRLSGDLVVEMLNKSYEQEQSIVASMHFVRDIKDRGLTTTHILYS